MDNPQNKRLLIVGDSMTLGAAEVLGTEMIARVRPTYVERLRLMLADWEITTDAAVKRTTAEGCRILPDLILTHQPNVVFLLLGGNDADLDWRRFIVSRGAIIRSISSLERFTSNLRSLIRLSLDLGCRAILGELPKPDLIVRGARLSEHANCDVTEYINRNDGVARGDQHWRNYNEGLVELATESGVGVAAWAELMDRRKLQCRVGPDGAHPNAEAHYAIAEAFAEVLTGRSCGEPTAFLTRKAS